MPIYTQQQAEAWRARYEAGETIEQLALDAFMSKPTMRNALVSVGTVIRPSGHRKGIKNKNPPVVTDGVKGKTLPVVYRGGRHSITGHRRRYRGL